MSAPITVHYHRDFDGMVSGAILARILRREMGDTVHLESVNYDQRDDWENFGKGRRFAIVDFHFHPDADYWFDHHPTTFLSPELRERYERSERWHWDEDSPSCPPLILRHAKEHWGYKPPARFEEMAHWSDIIDAAQYESVEQAIFGDDAALRIARSMTVSPSPSWIDQLAEAMTGGDLESVAKRNDVEKAHQRASRNRDKALEQFPPTVTWIKSGVILYDASSSKIRRERFAAFYHHPELIYSVGVIPTRSGFHITCGENPWNSPAKNGANGLHVGELMEQYGGGGHRAVGGANPPNLEAARQVASEVAETLVARLSEG